MMPHFDLGNAVGIAVGIIGAASYFRSANLNTLKNQVEVLRASVEELKARCRQFEIERDQARKELVGHYTARLDLSEENRDLHRQLHDRDAHIVRLFTEHVETQKAMIKRFGAL